MGSLSISDLMMVLAVLAIYFIPAGAAFQRLHPSRAGIVLLNIFLGWTLVGWVVALVWAYSGPNMRDAAGAPDVVLRIKKLEALLSSGAITRAEFDAQRAQILKSI